MEHSTFNNLTSNHIAIYGCFLEQHLANLNAVEKVHVHKNSLVSH